jgi:hypothetical protein
MLGESALGDLPVGDLTDRSDVAVLILCTGTLSAIAITGREAVLTDTSARLIYTAELHPSVVTSGRV